jgi:hypothetical protein
VFMWSSGQKHGLPLQYTDELAREEGALANDEARP